MIEEDTIFLSYLPGEIEHALGNIHYLLLPYCVATNADMLASRLVHIKDTYKRTYSVCNGTKHDDSFQPMQSVHLAQERGSYYRL